MPAKEILDIINNYLHVLLSWPVVFLVISFVFMCKFQNSIKIFLEHIVLIKIGPFEASQLQDKSAEKIERKVVENLEEQGIELSNAQLKEIKQAFDILSKEKEKKDIEIENQGQAIKYLIERSEVYEFSYLNLLLVQNSKFALLWFYSQSSGASTKDNFVMGYVLPPQIVNPAAEREAIFNVLLANGLLEQNGLLFKVSDKGIRFLKSIKLIS